MDSMAYTYFITERSKAETSGKLLDAERDHTAERVQQITRRILKSLRENPEYRARYDEIKNTITA